MLTLFTPSVPGGALKSGLYEIPTLKQDSIKSLEASETELKYPTRTGPSLPLTSLFTSGYKGSSTNFSNLAK